MDTAWLFWGLIFGSFGFAFFMYGKKQKRPVPLVCGIALMIFPYFVTKVTLLVVTGVALIAAPAFIKI
ncbi:MAG: hypothetical protein PVH05_12715 [Burkholderiales bacterium]|jgi:hypothetical protein